MYLTSGAKVRTRRSRTLRSPEVLYSCQSARVSSGDRRRAVAVFMRTVAPVRREGRDGGTRRVSARRRGRLKASGRNSDRCPDGGLPKTGDPLRPPPVAPLQT